MDHKELARRFAFHPPSSDKVVKAHERIRTECAALAVILNDLLPDGREKAKALNKLDEAAMYANAAVARTQMGEPRAPQ